MPVDFLFKKSSYSLKVLYDEVVAPKISTVIMSLSDEKVQV